MKIETTRVGRLSIFYSWNRYGSLNDKDHCEKIKLPIAYSSVDYYNSFEVERIANGSYALFANVARTVSVPKLKEI